MSAARHLIFGRGGAVAALCKGNTGGQDDSTAYNGLGLSSRMAIAGVSGEVAFYIIYLTVTYEQNGTPIEVTALIDDVALPTQTFVLAGDGSRKTTVLEVALTTQFPPAVPNYATRGLFVPRGVWFQTRIATAFVGAAGYVRIDAAEIEHEVVRETKHQGANP